MDNPEFKVHMLNDLGKAKARYIQSVFDRLLDDLSLAAAAPHEMQDRTGKSLPICAPGRELSIVRTKLEEACFFAKKSMANDPRNCIEEVTWTKGTPTP